VTWAAKKELIRSTVVSLSGLHAKSVSWGNKPDAAANKLIKLDVIQAKQEVPDRRVMTMNEGTGNYDLEASTVIVFTVSVMCDDLSGESLDLAELVRSGLAWDSTHDTLMAAGLVIVDFPGSIEPRPSVVDERMQLGAGFDVVFRAEFHRADPVPVSTIEHIEGSGDLGPDVPPITVLFSADREDP
jgi:hypothetical protein